MEKSQKSAPRLVGRAILSRLFCLSVVICSIAACGESSSTASSPPPPGAPPPPVSPPPPPPPQNSAPVISGSAPPSIVVGSAYSFTPSASDADGDPLTFSVSNLPSWASFNTASGNVSGTPQTGDAGTYGGIAISVSDGTDSATLGDFSIDVLLSGSGSVTLSWTPPSQNTDGSLLTDLAGYRIYYGLSMGSYPNRIDVDTPGISSYVVDNLSPNTYYFVATAVNNDGIESIISNVTSQTVSAN